MPDNSATTIAQRIAGLDEQRRRLFAVRLQQQLHPQRPGAYGSLAAFVTTDPGTSIDPAELLGKLSVQLPSYMLPATLEVLEEMPRTPNGKTDRRQLAAIARPHSPVAAPVASGDGILQKLQAIWCSVLGVPDAGPDTGFFNLGGDSIRAMQVVSQARRQGLRFSVRQLFSHPTIRELAAVVTREEPGGEVPQTRMSGEVPLLPIEHWFFNAGFRESHHWNQAAQIYLPAATGEAQLREALRREMLLHPALRMHFEKRQGSWRAVVAAEVAEVPLRQLAPGQTASLEELLKNYPLDPYQPGRSWEAFFVPSAGEQLPQLLLVAHHLIVDGVSWSILLQDLTASLKQPGSSAISERASLRDWLEALNGYARRSEVQQAVRQWLPQTDAALGAVPRDAAALPEQNLEGRAQTVETRLSREETTALLQQAAAQWRCGANEFVLAALVKTLAGWCGRDTIRLDLEGHGRDMEGGPDVSQTVGWFTSFYPLQLQVDAAAKPEDQLAAVKQALQGVPGKGVAVSAVQYLLPESELAQQIHLAMANDVLYNYLGVLDAPLQNSLPYRLLSSRSPQARRSHLLEVTAFVQDSCLTLRWTFVPSIHPVKDVTTQLEKHLGHLRQYLKSALAGEGSAATVSDFPLANLDGNALKQVADLLNKGKKK